MAQRLEYTLPNGSKLRVAGNNVSEIGEVLSAIGDRLQDLLERHLTGLDFVHTIDFGERFVKVPNKVQSKSAWLHETLHEYFRNSSPVIKVQLTFCTLFGGNRQGVIEVFEANGARTFCRVSMDVEELSKLAVFFQRRGRKAQYGKNCHCQVCQTPVIDEHFKPHRVCESCSYVVIN